MKKPILVFVALTILSVSCQRQARDLLRQEPVSPSEKPANFYPKPDNIPAFKANQIVVKLKPGASEKTALKGKSYKRANTMKLPNVEPFYEVNVPDVTKAVKEFQNNPNVEWAGLNPTHTTQDVFAPNDPSYTGGGQWNLGAIEAPAVWNSGNAGRKDVYVVVLDEGSLYWGCDLNSKLAVNEAEINGVDGIDDDNNGYIDDKRFWNWFDNSNEIYTGKNGHGTWCESMIGAESGNNLRIASLAPNVKIISLKFLAGFGYDTEAAKAIYYSRWLKENKGFNIVAISCSWGGGGPTPILKDAIHAAGLADINVVCAAGNSAQNTIVNPMYPAAYDEDCIISVGATNQAGEKAYFSNHSGTDTVSSTAVDIYAPGTNNLALFPINHQEGEAELGGTSMSTPLVAGAIALLASVHPELNYLQRKSIILNTAKRVSTLPGTRGILNLNNPVYFGNTEAVVPDNTCGVAPPLDLEPPTTMTLFLDSVKRNTVSGYATVYIHWTQATDNNFITGLDFSVTPTWSWWFDGNGWTGYAFNLPMDRDYDIKGRAIDSWGNGAAWSNVIEVNFLGMPPPGDNIPPSTPTNLVASNIDSLQFGLNWTASTDQGGSGMKDYKVIWRPVIRETWSMTFTPNTSYTVNSFLTPNTLYEVGVIARDSADNLSDTVFTQVQTTGGGIPPPPPPPPLECVISSNNLNAISQGLSVTLNWTVNVSGDCTVSSTRLERKKGSNGSYSAVAFNPSSPFTDNVSTPGQYSYRLMIQSSTGQIFYSNEKQIQVKKK